MEEKKGKNTKDLISWPRTSYSPISLWKGQVNWLLNMIAYKITYQIELIILSCPIGFQRNERLVFRIETNDWNLVMDTCFVNNIEQVPMKCLIFLCVWKRIQTEFVSHKLQVKWQKLINLENIYLENLDCSCLPSIKKKRIFLFRQQFNKEKNILIPEVKVREFWTILMSPLIYSLYSILVKVIFIGTSYHLRLYHVKNAFFFCITRKIKKNCVKEFIGILSDNLTFHFSRWKKWINFKGELVLVHAIIQCDMSTIQKKIWVIANHSVSSSFYIHS